MKRLGPPIRSILPISILSVFVICIALASGPGLTQETSPSATFIVTTTANSGAGSLRQAILDANNNPGADTITFSIPGGGFQTIAIASRLVVGASEPVVIDGTSQPNYAGTPLIIIDGVGASAGHECLTLQGNSTVKGLAFIRCRSNAIQLNTAGSNVVTGNFIGVDPSNESLTTSGNLAGGVNINRTPNNRVGGITALERNIISRNVNGINIFEVEATGNIVTGNYIGLLSNGTDAARNTASGILITNAPNNRIGGSAAGERNVIGGHTAGFNSGVLIEGTTASGNSVLGNFIGTDVTGTLARGNQYGVRISDGQNTVVGGSTGTTPGGACTGACNLISASATSGISISDLSGAATGTVIEGNFINLDATGTVLIGATGQNQGVSIGASNTRVGGTSAAARNVIVNGGTFGNNNVSITGSNLTSNVVSGNFIGTDTTGTLAIGTAQAGVLINGNLSIANNQIGGTTPGERNVISGGNQTGVFLGTGNMNTVQGNYIGTDSSGTQDLGNAQDGILIQGGTNSTVGTATGTTLGGACTGGCNIISGNNRDGVRIFGFTSTGNRVDYNYIGLNATGTAPIRNLQNAIFLNDTRQNIIGSPITTTFQTTKRTDNVPAAMRCIKDDESGDYIIFDDVTGDYEIKVCRGNITKTGRGEPDTSGGLSRLFISSAGGGARAVTDGVTGTYSLISNPPANIDLTPDLLENRLLTDTNVQDSTCNCPPTSIGNLIVGEVEAGGASGADQNFFNFGHFNQSSDGLKFFDNQADKGILIDKGSFNTFGYNDIVTQNQSAIGINVGLNNPYQPGYFVRLSLAPLVDDDPVLAFDLNNNGIQDANDIGDGDGGANNTQNHPVFVVRREINRAVRVVGFLQSEPNKRYKIRLSGVNEIVRNGRLTTTYTDLKIEFEVMTNAVGQAIIDKSYTGVDADKVIFQENLSATATVINSAIVASLHDASSFVDVLGDTSELMPSTVVPHPQFDFDDDGKTDIAVYRPGASATAQSFWYILKSSNGTFIAQQFGNGEDKIVPADWNGDGVTDYAVWRPSNGIFYRSRITGDPATSFDSVPWGISSDSPIPHDYDDDSVTDPAVFRSSAGVWYVRPSVDGSVLAQPFGLTTDRLVPADYNGDGQTDIAVYRNGEWYISVCPGCAVRSAQFGLASDIPVPADYDGDGKADYAVFRPSTGTWYILQSQAGFTAYQFGVSTDKALNGDFDGDGKNDISVWRPSTGDWWILRSSDGIVSSVHWGQNGDIPVPGFSNSP